jgi:hypothetical protein
MFSARLPSLWNDGNVVDHLGNARCSPGRAFGFALKPRAHVAIEVYLAVRCRNRDPARIQFGVPPQCSSILADIPAVDTVGFTLRWLTTPRTPATLRTHDSAPRRWKSQSTVPSSVTKPSLTTALIFSSGTVILIFIAWTVSRAISGSVRALSGLTSMCSPAP